MNEGLVVLVRGVISFFTLLIFTRLLGKQQVSQLTLFEYILGITVGSIAGTLTTDLHTSPWSHWLGLIVWIALVFILQIITFYFPNILKYVNGSPEIVIANGKILEKTLRKLRYSIFDLTEELRVNNIFDINEVEYAVLETNGKLTILKKPEYQNIINKDMNIQADSTGIRTDIILNGIIISSNLEKINFTTKWLIQELKNRGINNISDVYYASIDQKGNLFIDKFRDYIDTPSIE